jgi:lipoprotein NlpD
VVAAVAALLAGCAGPRIAAPVFDRAPPRTPAPVAAPAQSAPVADGFYVVKRGDTLYSIALEHGADYRELAQWNSLEDPTRINVGQTLRVRPPEDRRAPQSTQVGAARVPERIEARPLDKAAPEKATPQVDVAGFVWPAKGKVLAGFAEPRSKGIDIDGKPGDPIVAAAAGRVTYTGTGIPGLGKLVVIKHDNGFITVYAHNREIVVKEQQAVSRGQKIAELGATDAERPKLHFQIRKGSAPVDPMRYLPGL